MKYIPVLLILITTYCYSQDFVSIYDDYLPAEVKVNKSYSEQVSASLKAYADINPELIYYYINYLNEKLNNTGGEDYFFKNFPDIRKFYQFEFNDWIINVQKEITVKAEDKRLATLCLDYLDSYYDEDLLQVKVRDLESNTDSNLLNFFVLKYYFQDNGLRYESNKDYSTQRHLVESKKLSSFAEMMDHPDRYTKSDLRDMVSFWYIIEKNKDYNKVNAASVIINVLKYHYSNDNMFSKFQVGICYSFDASYMFMTDNSYGTTLYSPNQVERDFPMNSLSLSLRYKIYLSDYFGPFNLLNLRVSAGYGLINKSITGEKYGFWNTNVDGVPNRSEIFEFNTNNINLKSAEFVSANFSVPLIYLGEFVSLNLGAGMNLLFTNYELTYDYEYRKFESEFLGPKILSSITGSAENKKITSTNIKFYPALSFVFYPSNTYTLYLTTTPKAVSVELGMSL